MRRQAELLSPGSADRSGMLLRLGAPISFWGGVDYESGHITQGGHPQRGRQVAGTVLAIPATIGSSCSSAVLAELIRNGQAPAALLLQEVDAILIVGVLVAREMGWPAPTVARIALDDLPLKGEVSITANGAISWED